MFQNSDNPPVSKGSQPTFLVLESWSPGKHIGESPSTNIAKETAMATRMYASAMSMLPNIMPAAQIMPQPPTPISRAPSPSGFSRVSDGLPFRTSAMSDFQIEKSSRSSPSSARRRTMMAMPQVDDEFALTPSRSSGVIFPYQGTECAFAFLTMKSGIAHSLDFPIDVDFNSPPALDVLITACRPHQTSDFDDYPENESLFYPPNSPLTTSLEIANLSLLKKQWEYEIERPEKFAKNSPVFLSIDFLRAHSGCCSNWVSVMVPAPGTLTGAFAVSIFVSRSHKSGTVCGAPSLDGSRHFGIGLQAYSKSGRLDALSRDLSQAVPPTIFAAGGNPVSNPINPPIDDFLRYTPLVWADYLGRGAALAVEISVLDISTCKPLPNSMVEIWSRILNTCIRNVEASARERTGFRDTPDERKSRLAEADGDVMKDPINLERECVEEMKRYLYPTNTVSANSAITFLSSSNPSPEAPPPFLDNAEGPEHEANIPWGYRTVLEELAGVIDGLLEERQIESSVREEKIKDVLELRDEVGMLGGGVQEVEIRKGSHKERREQSIIDSEGIVYEKTKSKPTLHVKVPPNTDSNPSVSSTSTSPMLSTAIDSPATVISPPSATINITHGIFAISDSPPSTSPRNSSSPVFAVQTRENSIPHSSTLNIDTPSNTSHSSEVNKGGYLPTSPRRKDKGKARAPPEPVRHEPVLSPTSVLLGFRKGNVLLGPEEMEGEYDGEELRRELLETMIERPAPRSLHIDNPDEYGSILTPSPLSPTISNFYTNLIYSAVHTVDPSDTATCIIAASEFQSICTSNNATLERRQLKIRVETLSLTSLSAVVELPAVILHIPRPGQRPRRHVCRDSYCPFPFHGKDAEAHGKMYHSPIRTVQFDGMSIVLQRREDGKMPCACSAESHARFNFVKVFNMIRKVIHPAPNDPGYDDIPFQQSTPPRPPSNPIDPTSMAVYTSAALQLSNGGVPPPQAPTSIVGSPIPPILPLQPSTAIVSPPRSPDSPMSDMNIREEPEESMDVDSEQENVTEDEQQEDGQGIGSEYIPDGQESDSDDGGEDVDMDSAVENLPPSASQNIDSCRSFLLQYGIQVDPIYRFVNIYHHKQRKHYQNTKQILRTLLPPAPEILSAITSLGGHRPSPPDPLNGPIDPIIGVEVVNGTKCTIGDCRGHVHVNRESTREHQSLNTVKQYRSYIEVHPPSSTKSIPKGLELVLEAAEACNLLKHNDVFTLASSEQEKCAVFAQSHWDELLDGVSTDALIQTASASFHFSNPSFLLLRDYVRDYYQDIVPTLDSIPVLARRYLLTPKVKFVH
ncbi:hypothetical protein DFJ43DRAFT_1044770 [Lentinula guzmanii]|uniref:Uncharacterized protein n=1 Tax=Lentinula guzmanii TaxID=2804957 RepID=A0AA38J4Z6_9AGAR|nr:hypothetical protein DFJ43DRAFT_1044770 [Lentinula guzmanii]